MTHGKILTKLNRSANLPFKYIFSYPNMGTFYTHNKGGYPTALTGTPQGRR